MSDVEFDSFGAFAKAVGRMQRENPRLSKLAMRPVAEIVLKDVQDSIGRYQPAIGPFSEWEPLKPGTLVTHARYGKGDTPLDLTGGLRASYEIREDSDGIGVGSDSDKALYAEVGNSVRNVPARPVLGPSFLRTEKRAFMTYMNRFRALVRRAGFGG